MVLGLRRTTVSEQVGLLFCARPHPGSLRSPTLPFGEGKESRRVMPA
jgi:hypothetical protein